MLLALRFGDHSDCDVWISKGLNMNQHEIEQRCNFLSWYALADREQVSIAVRTNWEKLAELLIKHNTWIQIINTQLDMDAALIDVDI
jgi:hypothetical protein